MRHYDVPVLVRTGPEVSGGAVRGEPLPPTQFLWHDRLYVVREVLAQWRERTAWWTGAAGRGLHGETASAAGPDGDVEGEPGDGPAQHRADSVEERWDAADRWVWRVEASAGRSGATGTYDLSRVGGSGPPGAAGAGDGGDPGWRLVRVCD